MTCYTLKAEADREGWNRLESTGERGKAVGEINTMTERKKGEGIEKGYLISFKTTGLDSG